MTVAGVAAARRLVAAGGVRVLAAVVATPSEAEARVGAAAVRLVVRDDADADPPRTGVSRATLKPSALQLGCREAAPTSPFHAARPSDVGTYAPERRSSYSDAAACGTTRLCVAPPYLICSSTLAKDTVEKLASFASFWS